MLPRKIKVLIVEDNEAERDFMKEGFLATGLYEVIGEAENGNELLELLKLPALPVPDMVLTDLNMPGKDGYDVISDVKASELFSGTRVVVLSSAPFRPYGERCKALGACAYFTKPDSFLEYKDFATSIYPTIVQNCL